MSLFDRFKKKPTGDKKEAKKDKEKLAKAKAAKKKVKARKAVKEVRPKEMRKLKTGKKIGDIHKKILRPVVSEKAAILAEQGQYVFKVSPSANKIEIKNAIERLYGVRPREVRVIRNQGKIKRVGRFYGQKAESKKAIIALPKGESIDIYEGV